VQRVVKRGQLVRDGSGRREDQQCARRKIRRWVLGRVDGVGHIAASRVLLRKTMCPAVDKEVLEGCRSSVGSWGQVPCM